MKELLQVKRNYKDTLFRMIFKEKVQLLSLYNAVNGTNYSDTEKLEIVTLENAIYMNMKNDLAFVIDCSLNLYEHQSTYSPNMPLRNLFYISRELENYVSQCTLYSTKLIKLPEPKFIVFYNGSLEQCARKVLKLSDAYERRSKAPELELNVTMYNINNGKNEELLAQCKTLQEYMCYVAKVRKYASEMDITRAVQRAVGESIQEGILADFLTRYRAEAIHMSIFEYDEEKEMKLIRLDEREIGWEKGLARGMEKGIELFILDNISENVSDNRILEKLQKGFGLSMEIGRKYLQKYKS